MRIELDPQDLDAIATAAAAKVLEVLRPLLAKAPAEDELLTIEEAAAHLGVKVGWIYKRVSLGEIPYSKTGHFLRFSRREITEWQRREGRVPQVADAPGVLKNK